MRLFSRVWVHPPVSAVSTFGVTPRTPHAPLNFGVLQENNMTKANLRSVLEAITSSVSDQDGDSLEIIGSDFPLRTLVTVTDYYIQFGTMIHAAGQGFMPGSKSRFDPFLNSLNASTNIVKLTAQSDSAEDGSWLLMARAMIVSGSSSTEYDGESFGNILTIWHQDIAGLNSTKGPYTITGMLVAK